VAAAALAGSDPLLDRQTLLQVTAGMEGHADNAAASLFGGFVVAWETPGNNRERYHAERLDTHASLRPVAYVADDESQTAETRALLPERVPLVDAAFTGSRTALAVLAFTSRPDLLGPATEDRLHQGYRRPAYPRSADLVDALRARGVPAVISGAGPTVLAFPADGRAPAGLEPEGFVAVALPVDTVGATVETG
jgi:homoserine kinase